MNLIKGSTLSRRASREWMESFSEQHEQSQGDEIEESSVRTWIKLGISFLFSYDPDYEEKSSYDQI